MIGRRLRSAIPPTWKSNKFRLIFIPVVCVKKLGYLACRTVMPSEKLERVVLKRINKMEGDITQNNSRAELVRSSEESNETSHSERTIKDVKFREWVMVFILCFVNLINYMDRFTLAGILEDIQKYFNVQNDKGGLLQTAFVLSYMIFAPIFGYLGDRYSRKNIMAFGVFLWSLTTLIGSFMTDFWFFLLFRALVGIGEASYSTIAPTIISDLFVGDVRSKMLALFYFAIPVGSGMGYIVGSETAKAFGKWQWGLRVTPLLGVVAVVLIFFVLRDPERGQSEGSSHIQTTPWTEDLKDLVKNKSFMISTAGFTCVTFVAGALAWWGPKFIEMGLSLQPHASSLDSQSVSYKFGLVSMVSGILGVPAGSLVAQHLRHRYPRIDAHLCGIALLLSTPMVFAACLTASYSLSLCFTFVFFGELFLNLTWSIVADILLYVVLPTRRSTAEGFQLLVSHALGDAGSPYLIGVISEAVLIMLNNSSKSKGNDFKALQYALFTTCFVEILGAFFFLVNALYILQDKHKVDKAIQANSQQLLTDGSETENPS
ncbi:protein spinster isoform X4 [Tribolium castaneum]|uniref:Protein spinster-like Protein n=1 Tax=Tribolium castaneum TaxID=7070 RepID=D6WWV4_TRICA|nr:PREDICTED: protein spinster isoform X3 [Tribolium castaneum]EFA09102.2 Protein spinster-like Protein [Tribolium castaneum]|eukprot:XP_008194626.1 PREDICTED: protein spinster isoform X3 [Tribolium castaneum]